MNWLKRFIKALKEFIWGLPQPPVIDEPVQNPEPVEPPQIGDVDETPDMAEERQQELLVDLVNDGSPRSPDWYYIATSMKLDENPSKLSTINWYYKQFNKVEHEIKEAAEMVGVPWWFIAGIDMREMSFIHTGHFANGDQVLGTGERTYRIPRGLGPAENWMESVKQVFDYKARTAPEFTALLNPEMNFGDACAAWELYNGLGTRSRGEYNDYVTGFTNFHDETGRWVADRRYSRFAKVKRPGAAGFVLYLIRMGDLTRKDLRLGDI